MILSEIKARAERATKGPWDKRVAGIEGDNYIAATGPWYRISYLSIKKDNCLNDADFIAHSRTDIPDLLKFIEEAREIVEELRGLIPMEYYDRYSQTVGLVDKSEDWLRRARE
jgi:hypothetical protein